MGNYNPDAPAILGNEWAGIHDENVQLTPDQNTVEYGYTMTVAAPRTLADARFYTHIPEVTEDPTGLSANFSVNVAQVNVYPYGQEANTGPIRRVVIPVSNVGFVSGSAAYQLFVGVPDGTQVLWPGTMPTVTQVRQALANPQGPGQVEFMLITPTTGAAVQRMMFEFDIASYAQLLNGKRLLAVNFLYRLNNVGGTDADAFANLEQMLVDTFAGFSGTFGLSTVVSSGGPRFTVGQSDTEIQRIGHGEVQNYWTIPTFNASKSQQAQYVPWTMNTLLNYDGVKNALALAFTHSSGFTGASAASGNYSLYFMAMEVIFCEETRVATGGLGFTTGEYNLGANVAQMYDPINLTTGPVLQPGKYTVTISAPPNVYSSTAVGRDFPALNGVRPLYDITSHNGRSITKPFPVWDALGQTFSVQNWPVMPQISLHDSTGAVISESHVYGRRIHAQVWGSLTTRQLIDGSNSQIGASYDQVRFYARRFGATTVPLSVRFNGIGGAPTASIAPSTFDALPEIIDGWAEVTLPLSAAVVPTGTGANMSVDWFATGELAPNRWEVLGVTAPALSGTGMVSSGANANFLTTVPAAQRLGNATYLQPIGATDALTWMSPTVSGTASDPDSDAVFLLSQSPAAPTGLTLNTLTQSLTGVGVVCTNPLAVPTGMRYNRLTWTTSPVTGSGFGYYELQRMDTVGNVWETILQVASQAVTGFSDYEARVGIATSYRLRVCNTLAFAGPWSSTVTGTITASGVTGASVDNGVLLFSSNYAQSGVRNLAYVEALSDPATTALTFLETERVKLEWLFDKDYMNAFMPLERGGEQFVTSLLIQQAAVAAPVVQGAFRNLRDLGWAQLPYVCVRNDIGDRWYANVQVPAGTIQRNRTLQIAQITVTEITGTPYVVTSVT